MTQPKTTGNFKIKYAKEFLEVQDLDNATYALVITVYMGFTMLLVAFCFFGGPLVYEWFMEKMAPKKPIHIKKTSGSDENTAEVMDYEEVLRVELGQDDTQDGDKLR